MPGNVWSDYGAIWRTGFDEKDMNYHKNWQLSMGLDQDEPSTYLIDIYPKSVRDYIVWNLVKAIERDSIDGVYYDYGMPFTVTRNTGHPYGKLYKQRKVFFPLFAPTENSCNAFYVAGKKRNPSFRIISHASKLPSILSGYNDIIVSGEPLNTYFLKGESARGPHIYCLTTFRNYESLPQEYYMAEYSPKGYANILIPQILKWNKTSPLRQR